MTHVAYENLLASDELIHLPAGQGRPGHRFERIGCASSCQRSPTRRRPGTLGGCLCFCVRSIVAASVCWAVAVVAVETVVVVAAPAGAT